MKQSSKLQSAGNSIPSFLYLHNRNSRVFIIYLLFVIYFYLGIVCFTFSTKSTCESVYQANMLNFLDYSIRCNGHIAYTKSLYAILLSFIFNRIHQRKTFFIFKLLLNLGWKCPLKVSLVSSRSNRICRMMSGLCCWVFLLNFLLVTIVNPSLLNPGPNQENKLTFSYQNVQGLIPYRELGKKNPELDKVKVTELNSYISHYKPSVVLLNETWLKGSIGDSEVICDKLNYKIFRLDRSKKTHPPDPSDSEKFRLNGGGVLIAINRATDIESVQVSHKVSAEIVAATLTFKNGKKIIICTCYRVGTLGELNQKEVLTYLEKLRLRRGINSLIVVGDFNFPHIDWVNSHSTLPIDGLFLDMFSNLGMEQLVDKPTHIKGNILDLLLTDNPGLISNINVDKGWHITKSDHFPITFEVNLRAKIKPQAKREIYNFKHANWECINSEIVQADWNQILSNNDIESCWLSFKSVLFPIIDKHIPKMKLKVVYQPPWFDSETFELCREKERLRAKAKGSSNPEHYLKYSEKRKAFKQLAEKKMRDNILVDDSNSDLISKRFWSHVQSRNKSTRIPEVVHRNENYRSDVSDQAELFNEYFYDQFSSPSNYDISIDYSVDGKFDIDFNSNKIESLLMNISVNKAMGPDGLSGKVLKCCAKSLSVPLSLIFRKSYYSSSLPKEWKMANVVPVHKKGSKSDVENYRPISLTSIVVKTLERIVRDELMIRCNILIDQRQHGFLFGKSCGTQLIGFCDSLALSLNNKIRTDVIYFDFAKAFDSVKHDIILYKLKHQFHIDGFLLAFLVDYLKDRSQSVVLGNSISSTKIVTSGVPQGSILGPTLFVLFLNDISSGLNDKTNILMYADDTKIWREINEENDHHILQKDIDYLLDWALRNSMKFHPLKCKALMVSKCKMPLLNILPFIQFQYSLGHEIIDYCEFEKDLGIHINGTLNFTHHSDLLYSRANQRFGLLKRTCHFVKSIQRKRALYLTMVRSLFEHCPYIWRPSSVTAIEKLESLQKRALKWILGNELSGISYSSNHYLYLIHCKQLEILPIKFRFDFHDIKMFHSVVYGFSCVKLPGYIQPFQGSRLRRSHYDYKSFISSIMPRVTSAQTNFESVTSGILFQSFFYRAHLLWNKLPLVLRETIRPSKFKSDLINHLWNHDIKSDYDNCIADIIEDPRNYNSDSEYSDYG